MPKIIVTSHFRKGGKGGKHGSAGGLLKYMGTREGVERLPSDASSKPATKRQQDLIEAVIKKIPGTIQYPEYKEYLEQNTRATASHFLDAVMNQEGGYGNTDGNRTGKYHKNKSCCGRGHQLIGQADW